MEKRLEDLLSSLEADEAKLLRSLLDNLWSHDIENSSLEKLEKNFEVLRNKIREIEAKALKKQEEQIANPRCTFCLKKANEVSHMFKSGENVYAYLCSNCIEACYAQLKKFSAP